jgi:hypothetical protein
MRNAAGTDAFQSGKGPAATGSSCDILGPCDAEICFPLLQPLEQSR